VGNISCAPLAYNWTERINGYSTKRNQRNASNSSSIYFLLLFLSIYHPPSDQPICTPHVRRISSFHSPTTAHFRIFFAHIFFHSTIGVLGFAHSSVFVEFCLTLPTFVSWTVPIPIKKCMYYYWMRPYIYARFISIICHGSANLEMKLWFLRRQHRIFDPYIIKS